jgi:sugar/nucleoside kinase (ribokinase family)
VKTPVGDVKEELGGSATYFSVAASFFTDVKLVSVIGEDFEPEYIDALLKRGIDLEGLERSIGNTFRWQGEYSDALNEAKTLKTELNVLEKFHPKLPDAYLHTPYLFLGNIDPVLQSDVLRQVRPKWVACDTMNFWIQGSRNHLLETLREVDIIIVNEAEARLLAREWNLMRAAKMILALGPTALVIKRGEYGALLFHHDKVFSAPAYPLETVIDPTGAGDSFAGGLMGFLAQQDQVNEKTFRQGVIYGSVMASFCVEAFGLNRILKVTPDDIKNRCAVFRDMTSYEDSTA